MALIPVGGMDRDTVGPENRGDIEVVQLIVDGEGQDREIGQRALGFKGQGGLWSVPVILFPEGPFADNIGVVIQEAIDGVEAQVGHAEVVGVRVDEGNGQSPAPVLIDGAGFAGKAVSGFVDPIPAYTDSLNPYPFPAVEP
jgi:hypothetical protein